MARTYLSILTQENWLESKLTHTILNANYSIGYSGNDEHNLISFIKINQLANHVIFVKPTHGYHSAHNELDLRAFAKVDIIIIAPPLTKEQIALVQSSNISGYILEADITTRIIKEIINQLYRKGYYANDQIPLEYWTSRPKLRQIIPAPHFTPRESEVLFWMCHNFDYNQISYKINTGSSNVRNCVSRLKHKTFTNTSIALVALAIGNKWVTLDLEKFSSNSPFLRNLIQN